MAEPAPGLRVGRIAGVPVFLTPAWFLIVLLTMPVFGPQVQQMRPDLGPVAYLVALVYALALMLSILLHEVSHALAARACGRQPHRIVLDLLGGHTAFTESGSTPGTQFLIAAAGPATNLALAGVLWFAVGAGDPYAVSTRLLSGVMWTNGVVGLFNLLPGLPLDGGAMLESAVWAVSGRRSTGTRIAAALGLATAVGVVLYSLRGFLEGDPPGLVRVVWTFYLAQVLGRASWNALQLAGIRQRTERMDLASLIDPAVPVDPRAPVSALTSAGPYVVIDPATGAPAALVDPDALHQALTAGRHDAPVAAVSQGLTPEDVVPRDVDAFAVLERFSNGPGPMLVVTDHGRVVGVLRRERVAAALNG